MVVFDRLTNEQAVMHYSRHCNGVGGLFARLCSRTRQPMTNRLALLVHWSFSLKTKPCQFSWVTPLCTRL